MKDMELPDGIFWRTIAGNEVQLAMAIFAFVHRECEEEVMMDRSEDLLSCWCNRCEDVRTYEVIEVEARHEDGWTLP